MVNLQIWHWVIITILGLMFVFMIVILLAYLIIKHKLKQIFKSLMNSSGQSSLLMREKEYYERHRDRDYTDFEKQVVMQICSESLFPYYFYMIPTEEPWKVIQEVINIPEKIDLLLCCHVIKVKGMNTCPNNDLTNESILYIQSNQSIVYLFKIDKTDLYNTRIEYHSRFSIDEIEELDYEIAKDNIPLAERTMAVTAHIKFKNGKELILPLWSTACEMIKEYIATGSFNTEENRRNMAQRQIKKIEELYRNQIISETKLEQLKTTAYNTFPEMYKMIEDKKIIEFKALSQLR